MIWKYLNPINYWQYFLRLIRDGGKISYSQCGEDLIINLAISNLKIEQPNYIDIGANDPVIRNNTYFFYKNGSSGVCIEPNPEIFKKIKKIRARDTALQIGVGSQQKEAEYFVLTSGALNTFSRKTAEDTVTNKNYGNQKIEKVLKIQTTDINSLIEKYTPKGLDILSIDTEGYDLDILKSLNFEKYRPKIICVESLKYEGVRMVKDEDIINFLIKNNYLLFGDTYINSIFVDKKAMVF